MRIFSTVLIWALSFTAGAANYPAHWKWQQIETEHFKVIFPQQLLADGKLYADAAERAYTTLQSVFTEGPTSRIPILISDNTDLSNGSATFLPYPLIIAIPALPIPTDSIAHYQDWAYDLMIHELAHMYTFVPVHSFYRPLRYIFGSVIQPTGILPRWYMEGLAVEVESRYSRFGRLRAPQTQAQIRALTLDHRWSFENLSRINESSIDEWPFGQRPYLFGSLLWHNWNEKFGPETMSRLTQRYSRRLPFLLNGPVKDFSKLDLPETWDSLKERLKEQSQTQIKVISAQGEMKRRSLTPSASHAVAPSLSPNGLSLAYLTLDPYLGGEINVIERANINESFDARRAKRWAMVTATTRLNWSPDSNSIIFDQLNYQDRFLKYRDLYQVERTSRNIKRLTYGQRSSQPALEAGGKRILFISNQGGATELRELDLEKNQIHTLMKPQNGIRLALPEFLNAKTALVVGRDSLGKESIFRVDLATRERKIFFENGGEFTLLKNTGKGLLIANNQLGTGNLALLNPEGKSSRWISNSTTQILQGDIDPYHKEILFSELSGHGYRIRVSELKDYQPPRLSTPAQLAFSEKSEWAPAQDTKSSLAVEDYSPWRHLVPRYWIPFVYPVEGGMLFQGFTEAQDPSGRHAYRLDGSYDSVTKQAGYGLAYFNSTTPVDLGFFFAESNEVLGSTSARLSNQRSAIAGNGFIYGLSNAWRWGLSGQMIKTEYPVQSRIINYDRLGPTAQISYYSPAASLVTASWGDWLANLSYTNFLSGGERTDYEKTTGNVALRLRGPLPSRHSALIQAKGSYAPDLRLSGETIPLGDRTLGGNYLVSLVNSQYLLRGYPSGALVGRSLWNLNVEYRFPLVDFFSGYGTFPFFLRTLDLNLFVDGAGVDGFAYSPSAKGYFRSNSEKSYWGSGIEFILGNTAAYHMPVTVTLGLYYGFDERNGGGFTQFISLGYVGHGGVDEASSTSTRFRPASFAR